MEGFAVHLSVRPQTPGGRGIPKQNVDRILVTAAGVVGDYNVCRTEQKAGDRDKAVLLFPLETLQDLKREGWPVAAGHLGENVTTAGIPCSLFYVGQRYRIGAAELELSKPCTPCVNLNVLPYVGDRVNEFVRTLTGRRGWYARVLKQGEIKRYDSITQLI